MKLYAWLTSWLVWLRVRARGERGDVPGWVMVTVMSAVLVVAILAVFRPQIQDALSGIFDQINGKD